MRPLLVTISKSVLGTFFLNLQGYFGDKCKKIHLDRDNLEFSKIYQFKFKFKFQ